MATVRGGHAVTPPRGKKPWVKPADWEAKTRARWQANHPQPLFPSTNITGKERAGVLNESRNTVTKTYAAAPMPTQASYLQPFADAHARATAAGDNYKAYLASAVQGSQNLSGAYNAAMTGGIQAGQQNVQANGGSGMAGAIPSAGASLIPAAVIGSSFSQMLNAEQPYVGAAVNEQTGAINRASMAAGADYQQAASQRRTEIQDAVQKLYTSGLDSLQGSKLDANKAAVTEYLALGKTAYQAQQAANSRRKTTATINHNTATERAATRRADQADASLAERASYHQASLNKASARADAEGVKLKDAYKTLFSGTAPATPGKKGSARLGPNGQDGAYYTIPGPVTKVGSIETPGKDRRVLIMYGDTFPKGAVRADFHYPPKGTTPKAGRLATRASWDASVAQLRAQYGAGKITATFLKSIGYPARPAK